MDRWIDGMARKDMGMASQNNTKLVTTVADEQDEYHDSLKNLKRTPFVIWSKIKG